MHVPILTRPEQQCHNDKEIQNVPANLPEDPEAVVPFQDELEDEDSEHCVVKYGEMQTVFGCLEYSYIAQFLGIQYEML